MQNTRCKAAVLMLYFRKQGRLLRVPLVAARPNGHRTPDESVNNARHGPDRTSDFTIDTAVDEYRGLTSDTTNSDATKPINYVKKLSADRRLLHLS